MFRTSRLILIALTMGAAIVFGPGLNEARAQGLGAGGAGLLQDPFTFYYAYYLPNQQIQALRPKPMDTINQAALNRQYYATAERPSLYNPISPYTQDMDPLRPYSKQQGQDRVARPYRFVQNPSNYDGSGPSIYYQRAGQYFPGLRAGRGPNANVATAGRRMGGGRGGMGGMGAMGGMGGMGMPG